MVEQKTVEYNFSVYTFTKYLNEKNPLFRYCRFYFCNIFSSHLNSSVLNTVQVVTVLLHNNSLKKLTCMQLFFPAEINLNFVDTESYELDACNEAECYLFLGTYSFSSWKQEMMDEQHCFWINYSISLTNSWPTAKFFVTKIRSLIIFKKKIKIPLHVLSLKKQLVEM